MRDYKQIHRDFQRQDHDYREGWRQERDGIWLFIGIVFMGLVAMVGVMV